MYFRNMKIKNMSFHRKTNGLHFTHIKLGKWCKKQQSTQIVSLLLEEGSVDNSIYQIRVESHDIRNILA